MADLYEKISGPDKGARLLAKVLRARPLAKVVNTAPVLGTMRALLDAHEPAPELPPRLGIDAQHEVPEATIDVDELLVKYSVEELAAAAEEYYRLNIGDGAYFRSKPWTTYYEATDELISFSNVLLGVRPLKGMRVLDFGAGTGWTSRALALLGCQVIVSDVSTSALEFAERHFREVPLPDTCPSPQFMRFDGHRLDLETASIDRIVCVDAFHHVPNHGDVLREFARVLKEGGVAGFQEPGPNHSRTAQSQFEMRNFTVVERDILIKEIWATAAEAGFESIGLAVFTAKPFQLSVDDYEDFVNRGAAADRYIDHVLPFARDRRVFFLRMPGGNVLDSREREGLLAEIAVDVESSEVTTELTGVARLKNTGTAAWLPASAETGPVRLGAHLYDSTGRLLDRDWARMDLPSLHPVVPGTELTLPFSIPVDLPPGEYGVEFDLVAEHVAWFSINNSPTASVSISVVSA
jgi:ubiquinone/menaquinone biosynthesis C-methylase UbiE